jgi:isopentenyl phosphate kinase
VIPTVESFDAVADVLGASDTTDVSGGMAGKVQELLALTASASIFGPEALDGFLDGERVGTLIE